MKILSNTEYQRLLDRNDDLQKGIMELQRTLGERDGTEKNQSIIIDKLRQSIEEQDREWLAREQEHLQTITRLENEKAALADRAQQDEDRAIRKIDRRGFEIICRQCYKTVEQIEDENGKYVLTYKHTNHYGDVLNMVLPQKIRCTELSQLADILTPQEFPELTETLRLDRGLKESSLQIRYLPIVKSYWRLDEFLKDPDGSFKKNPPINFRFAIGFGQHDRIEGFLVFVQGEQNLSSQEAVRWSDNLKSVAQLRVDAEQEDQTLCFHYEEESVYLCLADFGRLINYDNQQYRMECDEKTKQEWRNFRGQVKLACKARWKAYLANVVIPSIGAIEG